MEYVSRHQSTGSLFASALALGAVVLFGSLFLAPSTAHAAALTSTEVQPASLVAGSSSTVTVTFTTATNLPVDGKIKIDFGTNFNVGTLSAPVNCTGLSAGFGFGTSGNRVTLTLNGIGGVTTAPATISCTLPTITNPDRAGSTGVYAITTTDSSDVTIDTDAAVAADTITAAALTSTNVQPSSLATGKVTIYTISFTTVNALEANGKIRTTFPSGFNVASAVSGTCSTMDGGFSVAILGQLVTIERDGTGSSESAGAQTCTLTGIRNPMSSGSAGTYTVSTLTQSGAIHDTDAAVTADTFFHGNGNDEEETATTFSVNLLTPEADDSFEAGSMTSITWESDGDNASYANLYYSEDGGSTWETIVTNTLNDGTYTWTTPHVDSDEVTVKIVTTDLADELATDTSGSFSLWFYAEDEDAADGEEDGEDVADDEDSEEVPSDIDGVMAGDYIKVSGGSTIYYVDEDMTRRPFFDEQTYFTYENSFSPVVTVSADTLSQFVMGAPMMPKAGAVLVKIQSVAKVYLVEEAADGSYELRWVTSEDVAEEMFGVDWNSYVVDVDVTLFSRYEQGEDVEDAYEVDTDSMKHNTELHD